MKTEIKARWVDALRSGDYVQGKSFLASPAADGDVSFCCLGVLCEIAKAEGVVEVATPDECARPDCKVCQAWEYSGAGVFVDVPASPASRTVLPAAVVAWAELERPDPEVGDDGETRTLSGLNDEGQDFDLIADLIEEYL